MRMTLKLTLAVALAPLEVGGVEGRGEELGRGLDLRTPVSGQVGVLAPTREQGSRLSQRAASRLQHFEGWKRVQRAERAWRERENGISDLDLNFGPIFGIGSRPSPPDARGQADLLASSPFSHFGLQSLARVNRGEVSKPNFRFEIELGGGKKGRQIAKPVFIKTAISGGVNAPLSENRLECTAS